MENKFETTQFHRKNVFHIFCGNLLNISKTKKKMHIILSAITKLTRRHLHYTRFLRTSRACERTRDEARTGCIATYVSTIKARQIKYYFKNCFFVVARVKCKWSIDSTCYVLMYLRKMYVIIFINTPVTNKHVSKN